jgi:hypothetical protein
MLKNQKAISRERVIGISFVDILIQAVFILFLAVTIGYVDPTKLLKIKEYEQVGRDLCNKVNKDSVKECREIVDPIIDKEVNKGMLALCMKPLNDRPVATARFIVISPSEVKFLGFTPQYFSYLEKKGDSDRLLKAKSLSSGIYKIGSIDQSFNFLMEPNCIHHIFRDFEGTLNRQEIDEIYLIISRLGAKSKQ